MEGDTLATTEFLGVRISVSADGVSSAQHSPLDGDSLDDVRELLDSDDADAVRVSGASDGVNYVAAVDSTGLSVLIEMASGDSSHTRLFDVRLPEQTELVLSEDGSVDVLGDSRFTVGTFEAPWAVDANGNEVPTRYEIDGDAITQVIEPTASTAYPVVADPKFTWGWITGTAYFNRQETGWLCAFGRAALGWMALSGFWYPVILAAVLVSSVYICLAVTLQKCVKIKSTGSVRHYSGGYCT